jgi:hypothetical protein
MKKYLKQYADLSSRGAMETGDHFKNGASPKSQMIRGNKRMFVTLLLLAGFILPSMAQLPIFVPDERLKKENLKPIEGGKENEDGFFEGGKEYAVIVHTELGKRDLTKTIADIFLKHGWIKPEDLKLDEIDDKTAQRDIPYYFHQSFDAISFMMGIKYVYPPIIVQSNLHFDFYDNGNVKITWERMKEIAFYTIEGNQFKHYDPQKHPDMADYRGHYGAAQMEGSFMLKALIVLNKGTDGLKEWTAKFDEYFEDIDTKFEVFKKVKEAGKGEWLNDEQFMEYAANTKVLSNEKYALKLLEKYHNENRLLAINQERWETKVRPVAARIFKYVNAMLDGSIVAVVEDGKQTYVNIDGTLLPIKTERVKGIEENLLPKEPIDENGNGGWYIQPEDQKIREQYLKKFKKEQY